jgi:hypothetical protein
MVLCENGIKRRRCQQERGDCDDARDEYVAVCPSLVRSVSLTFFFDLAAAVDREGHFLAIFHRLGGRALGSGFDVPDLRITGNFEFGYKLLLGQSMRRRKDTAITKEQRAVRNSNCTVLYVLLARSHETCSKRQPAIHAIVPPRWARQKQPDAKSLGTKA